MRFILFQPQQWLFFLFQPQQGTHLDFQPLRALIQFNLNKVEAVFRLSIALLSLYISLLHL